MGGLCVGEWERQCTFPEGQLVIPWAKRKASAGRRWEPEYRHLRDEVALKCSLLIGHSGAITHYILHLS